ncbi:hypothetical protein FRC09_002778 [Ceratobasidium sp. 395]|nr:hypothetical protein FRC09_002778 [Ceratobasidium sp. 395]
MLGKVRNQSRSLVSFNKLPAEIIVNILSLIDNTCIVKPYRPESATAEAPPFPLAAVSIAGKSLRNTAISAPSLWTHVDLPIGWSCEAAYLCYARSCLRYSRQRPLYVHIADNKDEHKGYQGADIAALLAPHAHRIDSISFHTTSDLARGMLLELFGNTSSYRTKELCLNDGNVTYYRRYTSPKLFDDRLARFLQHLKTVGIKGPVLSLESVAFRGLTCLKLSVRDSVKSPPTLVHLAHVLTACPELRALSLINYRFNTSSEVSIKPVLLPKLELLDLREITDTKDLFGLLSCIAPGSSTLALGVSADHLSEDETAKLLDFIIQSNVTRLHLENPYTLSYSIKATPLLTRAIPALQELALCDYGSLDDLANKYPLHVDRFPSLHTLHFLRCVSDSDNWRSLVAPSAIQAVYADSYHGPLPEGVPLLKSRDYFGVCEGEEDLEWPLLP